MQKATAKLGMDISTVSRRIRALEADLGPKLVENVSGRLVLTMAEAGGGACILPIVYADLSDKLVRLSDVLKDFDTDVWLLTHRDLKRNARVQAFLEYIYKGLEPLRSGRNENV